MYYYQGVYCSKDNDGKERITRVKIATEVPVKIQAVSEVLLSLALRKDKKLTNKDCIRIVRIDPNLLSGTENKA